MEETVEPAPSSNNAVSTDGFTLCLTPHGHLVFRPTDDGSALGAGRADRIEAAFARGSGHGLLWLGAVEVGTVLPPVFAYWRQFGARFMTALCTRPAAEEGSEVQPPPPPANSELGSLAAVAPVMPGAEYLTAEVLHTLWGHIGEALAIELAESGTALPDFLKALGPAWNPVGRVHFNLAENRRDEDAPFAFLAT